MAGQIKVPPVLLREAAFGKVGKRTFVPITANFHAKALEAMARSAGGAGANRAGTFNSLRAEAERIHEENGKRLQLMIREELEKSVRTAQPVPRKQRASHNLETAIMRPGNVKVTRDGFQVIVPQAMDETTPARFYWRNLEVGTRKFVGRDVSAFFAAGGDAERGGYLRPFSRPRPRGGMVDEYLTQHGGGGRTRSNLTGRYAGSMGAMLPDVRMPLSKRNSYAKKIVIKEPILPHWYIKRGIERFKNDPAMRQSYYQLTRQFNSR